jgi:mRNA interferase RelE/StbE
MKGRIAAAVKKLESEPPQGNVKKLKGLDGYRVRVGSYRILFDIKDADILVYKIEPRGDVYKR